MSENNFYDWPDLPDTRITSMAELVANVGKRIFVVHQSTLVRYDPGFDARKTVGCSEVGVYPWNVGPIIVSSARGFRDKQFSLYDANEVPRNAELFMAEKGDWGNKLRQEVTLLPLSMYNVDVRDPCYPGGALFLDQRSAELWAIQLKLTFHDETAGKNQHRHVRKQFLRKLFTHLMKA